MIQGCEPGMDKGYCEQFTEAELTAGGIPTDEELRQYYSGLTNQGLRRSLDDSVSKPDPMNERE